MKKNSFFAVLFLSAILISGNAYAWGRGCPHDESEGHGGRSTDLHEKYFHKVSFLMAHRRELALTEPQVDSILDKKNQVMRAMVEARAQEELATIDLEKEMHGNKPDLEKLNALIDTKTEAKKTLRKALVEAIVFTKNVLSAEQQAKVKELYLELKYPQESLVPAPGPQAG